MTTQARQRALRRAVTVGAPRGYVRSFIDEGEAILVLLKEMLSIDRELRAIAGVAGKLLVALGMPVSLEAFTPPNFDDSINAPLDAREREILSMVALGLLNREI